MHSDAKQLFEQAGLPIEGREDIYNRVVDILGEKMAELSVTHGLSIKRIELYDSQKASLLQELRDYKARECPA